MVENDLSETYPHPQRITHITTYLGCDMASRGGCLDSLVQLCSFGFLGVETTVVYGYKNPDTGDISPMLKDATKNIVAGSEYVAIMLDHKQVLHRSLVLNKHTKNAVQ